MTCDRWSKCLVFSDEIVYLMTEMFYCLMKRPKFSLHAIQDNLQQKGPNMCKIY